MTGNDRTESTGFAVLSDCGTESSVPIRRNVHHWPGTVAEACWETIESRPDNPCDRHRNWYSPLHTCLAHTPMFHVLYPESHEFRPNVFVYKKSIGVIPARTCENPIIHIVGGGGGGVITKIHGTRENVDVGARRFFREKE